MKIKVLMLILPMGMMAAGCASITRGTTEAFVVETTPNGAQVETTLGHSCEATPCTFASVKREAEFEVTISKEGYKTTKHAITHQTAGGGAAGMAGNVLVGGGIGAIIDANTGATQELVPNPLRVTLEPTGEEIEATEKAVEE